MIKEKKRVLNPSIYSTSFQDMIDLWVETIYPDDNVVVIWDAVNHLKVLEKTGFKLNQESLYDNKVLTVLLEDVRDCFYVMDAISSYEEHPYMQVFSDGRLLTDNLESLRYDITI